MRFLSSWQRWIKACLPWAIAAESVAYDTARIAAAVKAVQQQIVTAFKAHDVAGIGASPCSSAPA